MLINNSLGRIKFSYDLLFSEEFDEDGDVLLVLPSKQQIHPIYVLEVPEMLYQQSLLRDNMLLGLHLEHLDLLDQKVSRHGGNHRVIM